MRRPARIATVLFVLLALAIITACAKPPAEKLEPVVVPPVILNEGELAVGVDLSLPPFAGRDGDRRAGLDIDVAAALAEKLGLNVRYVDVKPSEAATALASREVDIVMSVPLVGAPLSALSLAGSYATNGPAFFVATESTASVDPSLTVDTLTAQTVGAQVGSQAFWLLKADVGEDIVAPFDTLRAALEALDRGDVPVVAGDAFVAAYISRDFPTIHFAGQIGEATPIAAAVAPEAEALGDAVRSALDDLAADGVLETLRRKWVGELPELTGPASEGATQAP